MPGRLAHRLLVSIFVLLGVLLVGFLMLQVMPADPAAAIAGAQGTDAEIETIRRHLGLDKPVMVQFALYLSRVVQGDLGQSIINNASVFTEITRAAGPTLELMCAAMIWSLPLGLSLGITAALRRGGILDRVVMAISVAGVSIPVFWVGLLLVQLAASTRAFPIQGRGGAIWTIDGLPHVILPATALGLILLGPVARMTRTTLSDALNADHVRTARAKGAGPARVVLGHALRTALLPIITLVGLQVGALMGGAVVTETIFAWPGVGRLAVNAITTGDYPMAQGAILFLALAFIVVNIAVDILSELADPRLRSRT
ncbi:ABC transporter permease [Chachezhania antarctica]|uniref:ABC transporter permease n=1 Tax=Chachezhania antarctica TaxID=2340860 RepID=UPI000EB11F57|nr:ABC transporter permease [Chachezhania antarctica]|tara:strand:+ start:4876 stop:5817 length:942 start_codon:yes stop_codon:yes gene_type:complete